MIPALVTATEKARARDVLMGAEPKPLVMQRRDNGPVLVSRCPVEPHRWRATWFLADMEPSGHSTVDTFGEAIEVACHYGGDPRTARFRSAQGYETASAEHASLPA